MHAAAERRLPLPGLLALALSLVATAASAQEAATYTIGDATTSFPHHWEECVGSGHASLTLRADWRAHLTRARKDLGVKRTRFHGLFDDDFSMSLGGGTGDGDPADDFKHDESDSYVNLDSLIDFYDSLGMSSPLFELSFMPSWLSTNTTRTVTHYKGITSPPSNVRAHRAVDAGRLLCSVPP
jgi:xylan 1,4-beta-xylosidase